MSDPVEPTPEAVKGFLEGDPGGPLFMLNMLRYDGDEGRVLYAEYARKTAPHLARVGGELIYAGESHHTLVAPDGYQWDTIALVRYPSRQAFFEMVADPEYLEISKLRTKALSAAVLDATVPVMVPA